MEQHNLSGAECKAFSDLLKKAVKAVGAKVAARVSGRSFADGTCGVVLILWNKGGEECHLITKTPAELQSETKANYRVLLSMMNKRPA